jgi:hypothetical protein
LASLYGSFYIAPDTSGQGSSHLYKAPNIPVSQWWQGNVSWARFSGTGQHDDLGTIGNFKFVRIGSNIAKVTQVGAYDFYLYFLNSNGNFIQSPYQTSTSVNEVDFGDFSSDQAGAQPNQTLPLAFMPKTYACLLDETSSGDYCTLPTTYSNYTNNEPSMFTYTANPSDPTTQLRPKGFCEDGWGPNPLDPHDPVNKCTYTSANAAAASGSPAVPTAPGINPGPVPAPSPPAPSGPCPCGSTRLTAHGQCVPITNLYISNVPSGQPYCQDTFGVATDGVTCYDFNNYYDPVTYPAAIKC